MSEAESPDRIGRPATIDDILELSGAATPHFALQLRGRIARLIDGLEPTDPVRRFGQRELERLRQLAAAGEQRGTGQEALPKMDSLAPAATRED
jgi:hypothetical protein